MEYKGLLTISSVQAQEVEETTVEKDKEEAKTMMEDANKTLDHFMLKPPQLKGEALFDHMIKHWGRDVGTSKPSFYLGIDV